ncbi:hypothetical protein NQ315_009707 [Exocentrus adspersus]|uniref:Uncharacterized protein n=1 Tax=Exocentrus adspersus TaxID=1586481 RepID=A0AAV8WGH4_9CUCU|nr:hypothetical protein NQ315_009707 [Exocentrus adspersus]
MKGCFEVNVCKTARMFPLSDQLTFQTTSSKVCKTVGFQLVQSLLVQITTLRSCEQLAIV